MTAVETGSELALSPDQRTALAAVRAWWRDALPLTGSAGWCDDEAHAPYPHTHGSAQAAPVMSVGGLAGTGKTTLTRLLESELGTAAVAYATPTHKAAAVLRGKLEPEAAPRVQTLHSLVYYPAPYLVCATSGQLVRLDPRQGGRAVRPCRSPHAGGCRVVEKLSFQRRPFLPGYRSLVVVDEASMLTTEQVEDLRSFGVPVLLVGDHGQLPPVQAEMNGWIASPVVRLEVNHRQGEGSEITALAHRVRSGYRPVIGTAGEGYAVLDRTAHGPAVEALLDRWRPGPSRVVVTWRNQTRVLVNRLLRGHAGGPVAGDRVVCLRSSEMPVAEVVGDAWRRGHELPVMVHNGELGTVVDVLNVGEKTLKLVVQLDGDRPTVFTSAVRYQFDEPQGLAFNDPRRPHGPADLWDYGYAVTAHKAQGSEFEEVIVVDEGARDYARWTYTAVTRAARRLVVVRW